MSERPSRPLGRELDYDPAGATVDEVVADLNALAGQMVEVDVGSADHTSVPGGSSSTRVAGRVADVELHEVAGQLEEPVGSARRPDGRGRPAQGQP